MIESKNYSGWIFGNENQYKWTMMLPNKETYSFYNPIKQNQTHMKWLKNYIGADIPLFSLIVFSERCELKKVTVENQDIQVINRDRTYATVRDIWNKKEDILSNEEVKVVYQKLKKLTNVTKEEKEIHIQDIKEKYDEISGDIPITVTDEKAKSCPRCGSMLVLRTAKKGTNAGKQFWGCSAFPKCRYIKND